MKRRTQKRGPCPICGQLHALNAAGRVADHGYTVLTGWGTTMNACSGSRAPHFGTEAGRDWLAKQIVRWQESIARYELVLAKGIANVPDAKLQKDIAGLRMAIAESAKRIAAWQPVEPVEVVIEDVAPTVHFAAKSYGYSAAICCASAMGAARFRGVTSAVELEVTCARCLKSLALRAEYAAKKAAREAGE